MKKYELALLQVPWRVSMIYGHMRSIGGGQMSSVYNMMHLLTLMPTPSHMRTFCLYMTYEQGESFWKATHQIVSLASGDWEGSK